MATGVVPSEASPLGWSADGCLPQGVFTWSFLCAISYV